jgi:hypothetical protein
MGDDLAGASGGRADGLGVSRPCANLLRLPIGRLWSGFYLWQSSRMCGAAGRKYLLRGRACCRENSEIPLSLAILAAIVLYSFRTSPGGCPLIASRRLDD